jgi:hypothetical protein
LCSQALHFFLPSKNEWKPTSPQELFYVLEIVTRNAIDKAKDPMGITI